MSRQRYINTKFWDDSYIIDLDPIEKLLFIYFLSNPLTTIAGIYEISLKRIAFDTGIDKDMVQKIIDRFAVDQRVIYDQGWLFIINFVKHQAINPKIGIGIEETLKTVPQILKDTHGIAYDRLSKTLNYINTNVNINTNINIKKEQEPELCDNTNLKGTLKNWCSKMESRYCPDKQFKQCMEWYNEYRKWLDGYLVDKKIVPLASIIKFKKSNKYFPIFENQLKNWMEKDNGMPARIKVFRETITSLKV